MFSKRLVNSSKFKELNNGSQIFQVSLFLLLPDCAGWFMLGERMEIFPEPLLSIAAG